MNSIMSNIFKFQTNILTDKGIQLLICGGLAGISPQTGSNPQLIVIK